MNVADIRHKFNKVSEVLTPELIDKLSEKSKKNISSAQYAQRNNSLLTNTYKEDFKFLKREIRYIQSDDKTVRYEMMKEMAKIDSWALVGSIWKKYSSMNPNEFLSEAEAIELLKICAYDKPWMTAQSIQHFEITNERAFIDLAKHYAEIDGDTAHWFVYVGIIKDQNALVELAKIGAKNGRSSLARTIESFKIKDENARIEIAKLCAQGNEGTVACMINSFDIKNKAALREIAFLCAENADWSFAEHIGEFEIENKEDRIALAKIYARTKPERLSKFINNFEIHDQNALIEIANECAQSGPSYLAINIKLFGIKNDEARIALAKLCIPMASASVVVFILEFGINDKKALEEIALLCSENAGYEVAKHIDLFDIRDQSVLIEVVKRCACKYGDIVAKYIQKFRIESQQSRFEIALICLQNCPHATISHFEDFNIDNQDFLIRLAEIAAQFSGGSLAYFMPIKKFNIHSEAARIELAKTSAFNNPEATAALLPDFEIENKEALVEIAKICAQNKGYGITAKYLHHFKVSDPATIIEIALLCAANSGVTTACYVQNFGIKDQRILIELAKICTRTSRSFTAKYIKNFKIEDKKALIEIAGLCLVDNVKETLLHIENFEIDEIELLKILPKCALTDGEGTIQSIKYFNFKEENIVEIVKLSLFHLKTDYERSLFNDINDLPVSKDMIKELQLYHFRCNPACWVNHCASRNWSQDFTDVYQLKKSISIDSMDTIERFIQKIAPLSQKNLVPLTEMLNKLRDPEAHLSTTQQSDLYYILLSKTKLLGSMYAYIFVSIPDLDTRQKVIESGLVTLALNYWQPHLRWDIFQALLPNTVRRIDLGIPMEGVDRARTKFYVTEMAQELIAQGVNKGLVDRFLKFAFSSNSNFKDGRVGGILIQLFVKMVRDPLINTEMTEKMLEKVLVEAKKIRKADFRTKYPSVTSLETQLAQFKKAKDKAKIKELSKAYKRKNNNEQHLRPGVTSLLILAELKNYDAIKEEGTLEELVQRSFCKTVPIGPVDNFSEKFLQTFRSNREPQAIFQYAASMARTNEPKTLQCLGHYITSVLNGTFKEVRYSTVDSPHMATIEKHDPHFIEEWKKGDHATFEELGVMNEQTENKEFDYDAWLRRKIGDGHIPIEVLGLEDLKSYREGFQDLHTLLDGLTKKIKKTQKDSVEFNKRNFEFLCLTLALNVPGELNRERLEQLNLLLIRRPFDVPEFHNDVQGLLKEQRSGPDSKYVVVNSDDPIDLLLAGTEIRGSCQKVGGSPYMNKGLLGYLMHGATRILKVSKSIDGPIEARCLLRLMWDEERPVLFRERFYPDTISVLEENALNAIAKRCAARLNIPLLSLEGSVEYGKPIHSLGGAAPFEYWDSAGGLLENGICTIPKVIYL